MTALFLLLSPAAPPAPADAPPTADQIAAWVADLGQPEPNKHFAAHNGLVKAGPLAKGHVPALVKLLDKDKNGFAADVLGAIGPDARAAVPALKARLAASQTGYLIDGLALALTRIDGPKPEYTRAVLMQSRKGGDSLLLDSYLVVERPADTVAHVVALADDPDPAVRLRAVVTLRQAKHDGIMHKGRRPIDQALVDSKELPAALEKRFADPDVRVRAAAVVAVDLAPALAEKAIPVVAALARDEAGRKALDEHRAVATLGRVPEPAARALIPLLDDPTAEVRRWATGALAGLRVREPLEVALKTHTKARVRAGAAAALAASRDRQALPALEAATKEPAFEVRFAAAVGVVDVAEPNAPERARAVPVLIEGCGQKGEETRVAAAQALRTVGPEAKAAVPTLKELLTDARIPVRAEAALALVAVAPGEAAPAVPVLADVVRGGGPYQPGAARALGALGPTAKPALPALAAQFDSKNMVLRIAAAVAVARIDPERATGAVEVIVALLTDPKSRSRTEPDALGALADLGPAAKSAMPALGKLLADPDTMQGVVARTMIAIDPAAAGAAYDFVRAALKSGRDPNGDLFEDLVDLGPLAKPLIPDLMAALDYSRNVRLRRCAIETLAAVGPDAKSALPALRKLAQGDPSSLVRRRAAEAVKKLEAAQ